MDCLLQWPELRVHALGTEASEAPALWGLAEGGRAFSDVVSRGRMQFLGRWQRNEFSEKTLGK